MKFMKGVIWGAVISTGVWMMCNEVDKGTKTKWMKQGKKWMKNMGMM